MSRNGSAIHRRSAANATSIPRCWTAISKAIWSNQLKDQIEEDSATELDALKPEEAAVMAFLHRRLTRMPAGLTPQLPQRQQSTGQRMVEVRRAVVLDVTSMPKPIPSGTTSTLLPSTEYSTSCVTPNAVMLERRNS